MDRYSRLRGGSALWTDKSVPSEIYNAMFWGVVGGNKFWIKVAGVWKECVTWIKVAGVWKETEVKFKNNNNWS